jgi:hypothetical protein
MKTFATTSKATVFIPRALTSGLASILILFALTLSQTRRTLSSPAPRAG